MKRFALLLLLSTMMFAFVGCGSSAVSNEDAGSAVKAALEARWSYQSNSEVTDVTTKIAGEEYLNEVEAELEPLESLREAEFEDPDMGEAVKAYISVLDQQKDLYTNYNGDFWTMEYNNIVYRQQRQEAIKKIADMTTLEFTGENKESFDNIMDASEFEALSDDAQIVEKAFTIVDTNVGTDEWGDTKASFKVQNNTGYNFPEYAVMYRVKASDGTTISSENYTYINNFEAGSTSLTEDIGYEMEDGHTVEAYGYIAGVESGYIYNEVEFDEPIVLKK